MATGADVTATFCATLVDEWVRAGVTDAVIAPGSRSTPLAVALADAADAHALALHVHHDERSASFMALGIGLATGRPAVLACTSGTAAAHFHAAVIEAHQSQVPMVVCTADRPPELRDVGAPQTIDQTRLYGSAVRWFVDPGVPDDAAAATWRSLAARTVIAATAPWPGPVHLNLPFREPLLGAAGPPPPGRSDGEPWHVRVAELSTEVDDATAARLRTLLDRQRGVVIAGAGAAETVHDFSQWMGWPVLADPRSDARVPRATTVAAFDALLRHRRFARDHTPEVVVRFGAPPASKVLDGWLAGSGADHVVVGAAHGWSDARSDATLAMSVTPEALLAACRDLRAARTTPWAARWRHAAEAAQQAIDQALAGVEFPNEPAIARWLVAALADGSNLVASSSMPVRDVEWYAAPRSGVRVLANRGANGIDGVVSTAIGVALASGRPTALLIGDIAFLHDSNGLIGLRGRELDLTIVVIDNDGGAIFEFLPQAHALERSRFEYLFGTPHGVDVEALARAHGLTVTRAIDRGALERALGRRGPSVVVLRTDRRENVAVHERVNAAVSAALDRL